MRPTLLLVGKDARLLRRSPLLLAALVIYPLIIAILVGLVVRFAGEQPRVALVDADGLPEVVEVAGLRFNVQELIQREVEDIEVVPMGAEEAQRALEVGDVLATLTIPDGFLRALRGMLSSPEIALDYNEDLLGTRILTKVQALVFSVNSALQEAYIDSNLVYVDLLTGGGSGTFAGDPFNVIGLDGAEVRIDQLVAENPDLASELGELSTFVTEARLALGVVEASLRATARPIELQERGGLGRDALLSGLVQAYAFALTLTFVAVLLAAGSLSAERDENVIGRLVRGLVGLGQLLLSKIALVALVGAAVSLVLAVVFGLVVEASDVAVGQPWERLPLLVAGFVLVGGALGAFGTLIGTAARDTRTAMLLAILISLPVILLGLVPSGSVPAVGELSDLFPFIHGVRFFDAVLVDSNPAAPIGREIGWLIGLGAAYAALARLGVRRLLV